MIFQIALRNIFRHRIRSMITLASIAFGGTAIIFAGGFFEDMFIKIREGFINAHSGHLQVYKKGFSKNGRKQPYDYLIENPNEIMGMFKEMKHVRAVTARLQAGGLLSNGETSIPCYGQGVEPNQAQSTRLSDAKDRKMAAGLPEKGIVIESGDVLTVDKPYGVILGRGLAAALDAKTGDNLIFLVNTVQGSINASDVQVQGIFFSGSKDFDDYTLRLPLPTAQQLLRTNAVQSVILYLDKTEDTEEVKEELEQLIRSKNLDLELKTWNELSDFYNKTRQLLSQMFRVLKLVIAIIVILSISNMINVIVRERSAEIGTLRAMGTKRRAVLQLFLAEGALLGFIGGLIGVVAGCLITWVVGSVGIPMPPPPGATMSYLQTPLVVPSVVCYSFVLSIITTIIATIYPAYTTSRLEIARALRQAL